MTLASLTACLQQDHHDLTDTNDGLWTLYHNHVQFTDHQDCEGTLAATDGSVNEETERMPVGGGITYRHCNGTNTALPSSGIAAKIAALEHLLVVTATDEPLTVLMDALMVLQNLIKAADGKAGYDADTHQH
eukprot:152147-Rhodomonas_salina.2